MTQPTPSKLIAAAAAAALVRDGDTVTINASSGLNCPDRVLRAIGERFEREGHPRDLTTLHPIAAGDLYGIGGIRPLSPPRPRAPARAGSLPQRPLSPPHPPTPQ